MRTITPESLGIQMLRVLGLPFVILWQLLPERMRRQLINAMHPWLIGVILIAIYFILFFPAYIMSINGLPVLWQMLNTIFLNNAQEAAIVFLTAGLVFTFVGFGYRR